MKPVLYLDVDGVLWDLPRNPEGVLHAGDPVGARGVEEFIDFAHEHFEVRWCTTWAMRGQMHSATVDLLAAHTGVARPKWARVGRSLGFRTHKLENINLPEHLAGRAFVWVEDGLSERDHQWLREHGWQDRYFYTDVFEDPDALVKTMVKIREWLGAP